MLADPQGQPIDLWISAVRFRNLEDVMLRIVELLRACGVEIPAEEAGSRAEYDPRAIFDDDRADVETDPDGSRRIRPHRIAVGESA